MLERLALLLATVASLAVLLHSLPVHVPAASTENARYRRKVAQLRVGSTPMDYMIQLKSDLSDERGTPKNYTQNPTSVWCFMDKDINEDRHRVKPVNEEKCKTTTRYLFNWDSVTNSVPPEHIPLTEGLLRPYLQVINRHVDEGEVIPVHLSVEINLFIGNGTTANKSSLAQLQSINVSMESNGWLELDITPALSEVWPPTENSTVAEVQLIAEVDCEMFKKVPLNFINPAEIPLNKPTRRERHMDLQPLLLVFSDDSHVKEQIAKGEQEVDMSDESFTVDGVEDYEKRKRRRRQNSASDACHIEDFTINFADLGLSDIVTPESVNIRRCSGSCSHSHLKESQHQHLATNHAKIMASAKLKHTIQLSKNGSSPYSLEPKEPCCSPVEYDAMYVLKEQHTRETDFAIELKLYPNFVVKSCGCR